MEIIKDRHGKRSTLFTSQAPVEYRHEVIGEQTIADASWTASYTTHIGWN